MLPFATEPVGVWPARPVDVVTAAPELAAQRRPSTPLLHRQPSMIVTDPTPLAPPPSPIPNFSQYLGSDDFRLRYSDKTIFKMAAVHHLEF